MVAGVVVGFKVATDDVKPPALASDVVVWFDTEDGSAPSNEFDGRWTGSDGLSSDRSMRSFSLSAGSIGALLPTVAVLF